MQRKRNIGFGLFLLMALMVARPEVTQANSQKVVLGFGLGGYTFSKVDDERQKVPILGFTEDMMSGLQSQLYVEWYALDSLGFGLRSVSMVTAQAGTLFTRSVDISSTLITLNWVPVGSDSYARLGVLAGVGGATYRVTLQAGSSSINAETSGSASLLGAYLDWGGGDFGARLGVNSLKTKFDDLGTAQVDGSGRGAYLDLRWAWN